MEYYIINKVHVINGGVVHTPIGFTLNINDVDTLNNNFDNTLGVWINANKSDLEQGIIQPTVFFESIPEVFYARQRTTDISGMNLNEITDITAL
jgi:hypothetical protein